MHDTDTRYDFEDALLAELHAARDRLSPAGQSVTSLDHRRTRARRVASAAAVAAVAAAAAVAIFAVGGTTSSAGRSGRSRRP
jgi:hypothetical protein